MTVARSPELELRALIAELTRARPESIDLASPMDRQGLDSLQLIILRERLESSLAVVFSDEEWMALDTPASVLARVSSQMGGPTTSALNWTRADLEIGMPLTGPLRFQFASLRAVSDSLLQQFWRKELMAKRLLQCEKF